MKQFLVILSDKQANLMNGELLHQHIDYLKQLHKKKYLVLCGTCANDSAMMIIQAESQESAEQLITEDPFSKVNYYQQVSITEFRAANPDNDFLLNSSD